jgi:formylglycine-generating enzyme required for sulfatase activity/transcriptional regulator with XRE-family HTH domain
MQDSAPARRNRKKVRLDPRRLREERSARDEPARGEKDTKRFTQEEMAEYLGIGLSTYQKAEAGECIDESIARKIVDKLDADETDLGLLPCTAPPPRDTAAYLSFLHNDSAFIDVRGLIVGSGKAPRLPIEKVYIPLRAAGGAPDIGHGKAGRAEPGEQRQILLEQLLGKHRKLVVKGDPGGGKSTFLKRLAYEQSGPGSTQFPVLIRIFALEDFIHRRVRGGVPDVPPADSADWIPRYLEDRAKEFQWGLDADFFRARLRERSTLILLDGLDEVPNAARREAISRLFERATKAYRDAGFVVTTRPASYTGKATLEGFETVSIGDLDTEAVEGFLEHWSGFLFDRDRDAARRHNEELLSARRARPEIRRMTLNPLMLTALAVIQWNERRLPEQRADLYESILKWLSEAQYYKNRRQGHECLAIFGVLALGMQCYPGGRLKQIEKSEAARIVAPEFRDAPEERREAAAREFLESELVDSGIIVSRGDSLEFWHLTFQEYLAARACADFDHPAQELFRDDRWSRQEWREVMLLIPGVLIRTGPRRVDAIFQAALDRAAGDASLAIKARAAGLLGAALHDVRASRSTYRPPDEARYHALLTETLGIFDARRAAGIDLRVRIEAAEALGQAGDPRIIENPENNWIPIAGGTFLMGAQKTRKGKPGYDPEAYDNEGPVREVSVGPFQIGRYPVTVEEYRRFVEDEEDGYRKEQCWASGGYEGREAPDNWDEQILYPNRPVTFVNWFEASAYCVWASAERGARVRLPTEEEWEFAARGAQGRRYPWGNETPDPSRANYSDAGAGQPTPVGLFPAGNTTEGVADMAGNVLEWTLSDDGGGGKALRGGSCYDNARIVRVSYRCRYLPGLRYNGIGFRCVGE